MLMLMLKLILNSSSMLVLVMLVLPLLLLVLPQLLLQLLLPQDANRRLTDSAELSQSSPAEQLLCQSVSQFLIVCQSPSAPRSQDKNVTPSPELSQRQSVFQSQ